MGTFRRMRKALELYYHSEYGGYIPAMMRSMKQLKEMNLTPKEERWVEAAATRKMKREKRRDVEDWLLEGPQVSGVLAWDRNIK